MRNTHPSYADGTAEREVRGGPARREAAVLLARSTLPTDFGPGVEISCRVYRTKRSSDSLLLRLVGAHLEELLRVWPARFARRYAPLRAVVERVLREFLDGQPVRVLCGNSVPTLKGVWRLLARLHASRLRAGSTRPAPAWTARLRSRCLAVLLSGRRAPAGARPCRTATVTEKRAQFGPTGASRSTSERLRRGAPDRESAGSARRRARRLCPNCARLTRSNRSNGSERPHACGHKGLHSVRFRLVGDMRPEGDSGVESARCS